MASIYEKFKWETCERKNESMHKRGKGNQRSELSFCTFAEYTCEFWVLGSRLSLQLKELRAEELMALPAQPFVSNVNFD